MQCDEIGDHLVSLLADARKSSAKECAQDETVVERWIWMRDLLQRLRALCPRLMGNRLGCGTL